MHKFEELQYNATIETLLADERKGTKYRIVTDGPNWFRSEKFHNGWFFKYWLPAYGQSNGCWYTKEQAYQSIIKDMRPNFFDKKPEEAPIYKTFSLTLYKN